MANIRLLFKMQEYFIKCFVNIRDDINPAFQLFLKVKTFFA